MHGARSLKRFTLSAMDGDIGRVVDVFFDSHRWAIRYVVVDTGGFLSGRRVLISPIAIGHVDWTRGRLAVRLSKRQVENAPDVDLDKPVTRQHELAFFRHFGWNAYWPGPFTWGAATIPGELAPPFVDALTDAPPLDASDGDPNLHSLAAVTGYTLRGRDGELGTLDDLQFDPLTWEVRYLVVTTGRMWSGRRALLAPHWAQRIVIEDRTITFDVPEEELQRAPEWNHDHPGLPDEPSARRGHRRE